MISDAYAEAYLNLDTNLQRTQDRDSSALFSRVLRGGSVKLDSPSTLNVLLAMLFVGLVVGPGIAFLWEFFRAASQAGGRKTVFSRQLGGGLRENSSVRGGDYI
jgi:hypothetical protein